MKVISGLYPGVTTIELDNLAAETAATLTTKHPDYAILAARIAVSNLHKETKKVFSGMLWTAYLILICCLCYHYFLFLNSTEVIDDLHKMQNKQTGKITPMISDYHHGIIMKHADRLNSAIIYDRDFNYNYFGFKVKIHNFVVEGIGLLILIF